MDEITIIATPETMLDPGQASKTVQIHSYQDTSKGEQAVLWSYYGWMNFIFCSSPTYFVILDCLSVFQEAQIFQCALVLYTPRAHKKSLFCQSRQSQMTQRGLYEPTISLSHPVCS